MQLNKLSNLNRAIKDAIFDEENKTFYLNEGMEKPTFKITIEPIEKEHFIDKNGTKWVKCKDDSDSEDDDLDE